MSSHIFTLPINSPWRRKSWLINSCCSWRLCGFCTKCWHLKEPGNQAKVSEAKRVWKPWYRGRLHGYSPSMCSMCFAAKAFAAKPEDFAKDMLKFLLLRSSMFVYFLELKEVWRREESIRDTQVSSLQEPEEEKDGYQSMFARRCLGASDVFSTFVKAAK